MEKKTRGIRNNNWLNIRRSSNNWQGKTKDQLDQKFVTFVTPEYGYRAAWKILESPLCYIPCLEWTISLQEKFFLTGKIWRHYLQMIWQRSDLQKWVLYSNRCT